MNERETDGDEKERGRDRAKECFLFKFVIPQKRYFLRGLIGKLMAKFTVQTKSLALGIFRKKQHIKMISTDSASLIPRSPEAEIHFR